MSELATVAGGSLAMPEHDFYGLVKRTICKGATDDELRLFHMQCKRTGLDPFLKQIHAVKRWDAKEKREVMSIQVGIDGLRLVAERTGLYAGNDDPVFDQEGMEHPEKATVTVWKIVQGQRVGFTRSARWAEFVQTTREGNPNHFWAKMPYLMLGKVAEALALRAAFPNDLSGLYTPDEMGNNDQVEAAQATQVAPVEPVGEYYPSAEEFKEELKRTGRGWGPMMTWLTKECEPHTGRIYTVKTKPNELDPLDARHLIDALRRMPNKPAVAPLESRIRVAKTREELEALYPDYDRAEKTDDLVATMQEKQTELGL